MRDNKSRVGSGNKKVGKLVCLMSDSFLPLISLFFGVAGVPFPIKNGCFCPRLKSEPDEPTHTEVIVIVLIIMTKAGASVISPGLSLSARFYCEVGLGLFYEWHARARGFHGAYLFLGTGNAI